MLAAHAGNVLLPGGGSLAAAVVGQVIPVGQPAAKRPGYPHGAGCVQVAVGIGKINRRVHNAGVEQVEVSGVRVIGRNGGDAAQPGHFLGGGLVGQHKQHGGDALLLAETEHAAQVFFPNRTAKRGLLFGLRQRGAAGQRAQRHGAAAFEPVRVEVVLCQAVVPAVELGQREEVVEHPVKIQRRRIQDVGHRPGFEQAQRHTVERIVQQAQVVFGLGHLFGGKRAVDIDHDNLRIGAVQRVPQAPVGHGRVFVGHAEVVAENAGLFIQRQRQQAVEDMA